MNNKNYVLLGPPGSGKSTQAEVLRKTLSLRHIDVGSELRAAAEEETALGREINEIINRRKELVPDSIVGAVLKKVLSTLPSEQGVLIDGAPRRVSQIDEVREALGHSGRTLAGVIFIELSEADSIDRISRRFLCFGCRQPYIFESSEEALKSICSICGGKIGQRKDDTPEGIHKRFQVFQEETRPVIEKFESEGLLFRVSGNQTAEKTSEEIFQKIGGSDS